MASIFSLFGEVFIDNTNANKSIDQTTEKAENSGSKVGSAFSSIAKGAAAVGTAVVTGAATLGAAAFKMANDTANTASAILDSSMKVGMSAEEYQKWTYAASMCGMEANTLEKAMIKQQKAFSDAKDGSKSMSEAYNRLGIDINKVGDSSEAFDLVINRLADMKDETERNALANDIFGKSYAELAPMFNEGADGIAALRQEAVDLGTVMSNDAVAAGEQLGDSIDKVKQSFKGTINTLGSAVIPIVQKFIDFIIEKMPLIQGVFQRLAPILSAVFDGILPPIFELVETLLPILFELIESLLPVIEDIITAILPVIIDLIQQLLPFLVQIIQQVLPIVIQLIEGLMPLIAEILNTILPIIIQLLQAILPPLIQIIQAVLPVIIELIQLLLPPILKIVQAVLPVIVDLLNAVMPLLVQIIEAILPVITELIEMLLPPILQIVDMILPLLVELINSILPLVISIIESLLPILISLLEAIMPLMEPILDLLVTFLEPLMDLLNLILPPIINLLTSLINKVLPPLQRALSGVAEVISTVFKGAFEGIGKVVTNIKNVFTGIIEFVKNVFTGNWRGAWDAVVKIFSNIFEGIKNAFKVPINWIIDGINVFIRGLNKIKIPDWVPSVGGLGLNIKELSRLRIGMSYVPYDEYPALLHKGERVLTEGENKEYSKEESKATSEESGKLYVTIQLGEKAIYIEHLDGENEEDMESWVDHLLELIADRIKRKELVFG